MEIGAAGALLAHRAMGDTVAILTLSRGARGGDQLERARESQRAADIIGAPLFLEDTFGAIRNRVGPPPQRAGGERLAVTP